MPHCAPRRKVPLTRRAATWQVADAVGWDSFAVGRAFKTICTGLDLGQVFLEKGSHGQAAAAVLEVYCKDF